MNGDVAKRARLVFLSLIVESWSSRRTNVRGQSMATQAQQVDLVLHEHALIRGAVRRMADHAAFDFRLVLVYKRPLLFRMAFVADFIARGVGAQLLRAESAVWAVAIVALNQAFVDAVVEGPRELRAHIHVAGVAEFGRLGPHQKLAFFCVVRRMALNASNAVG